MAENNSGRSHQYAGNSVSETGDKMKGGAVKEERSPEKDAMLYKASVKLRGASWMPVRFDESRPRSLLAGWDTSACLEGLN